MAKMVASGSRLRAAALALALATSDPRAAAAAEDPAVAQSRNLFEKGRALADAHKYSDACPLLQRAHDLHATNGTAVTLADCYENEGRQADALKYYQYVVDHRASDRVPERVALAEQRIKALSPHTDAPPAQPSVSATTTSVAPPPADAPPSRVPAIVAFGAGGAGLAVGIAFGLSALASARRAKEDCSGFVCPPDNERYADSANTKAWVSNTGFFVAIAGVATGIAILALSGSSKPAASATARFTFGPSGVGARF